MTTITIQQKCYARLLSANRLDIGRVPEADKVNVYAYAVKHYGYDLTFVQPQYLEDVQIKISQLV